MRNTMGFGRVYGVLLVSVALAGTAACGASSSDSPPASAAGSAKSSAVSISPEAPTSAAPEAPSPTTSTSRAPAPSVELPMALDESKFCKGIDEAAIEAAMGASIVKRGTTGRDPNNRYCRYFGKPEQTGVNIVWLKKPTDSVAESRTRAKTQESSIRAGCTLSDVGSLDANLAYQSSCVGYKDKAGFAPRDEMVFFQVGKSYLACQVFGPPKQTLKVDADGAASFCQKVLTSLT